MRSYCAIPAPNTPIIHERQRTNVGQIAFHDDRDGPTQRGLHGVSTKLNRHTQHTLKCCFLLTRLPNRTSDSFIVIASACPTLQTELIHLEWMSFIAASSRQQPQQLSGYCSVSHLLWFSFCQSNASVHSVHRLCSNWQSQRSSMTLEMVPR